MKNFRDYFKKRKWAGWIPLALVFLTPLASGGLPVREVSRNVEKLKSIESPFQFAVIGDSRDGEKIYAQFLQRILKRQPGFVIHLGDMISKPGEKEWRTFFEISKSIDFPFLPAVGNHDVGITSRGRELYRKQFFLPGGETYYAFRAGDGLFVVLDSEMDKGKIVNEQWSWLERVLSSSHERTKTVFLHRPLFPPEDSLKRGKGMDRYPPERDNLHRLFVKTGVKAVFSADDHRYDRGEKDNILYVITGGGGAPIFTLKAMGGYFHYVWVSVEKGKMEAEVVDFEEEVRDRFRINREK